MNIFLKHFEEQSISKILQHFGGVERHMWINISEPRVAPRGQNFFWDLRARMAVFNDFAPPCMYSMCDRLGWIMGWISLGRALIHIIFLFPMDGTGDRFGTTYGTCHSADQASHQFVRARRQRRSRRAFCVRTSLQQSSAPVPDIL